MFWRSGLDICDIEANLQRSKNALVTALSRNSPDSDIKLVEESIRVQCVFRYAPLKALVAYLMLRFRREALEDQRWTNIITRDDVPFVVHGLSSALQKAWLRVDAHLFNGQDPLLDAERLCKLQEILRQSPLISEHKLVENGLHVAAEETRLEALRVEAQRLSKRKTRQDDESMKIKKFNVVEAYKEQELNQAVIAAIDRQDRGEAGGGIGSVAMDPTLSQITVYSSISIGHSASSKINYIIRKVHYGL